MAWDGIGWHRWHGIALDSMVLHRMASDGTDGTGGMGWHGIALDFIGRHGIASDIYGKTGLSFKK